MLINNNKFKNIIKLSHVGLAALFFMSSVLGGGSVSDAATVSEVLPSGGAGILLAGGNDLKSIAGHDSAKGEIEDAIDSHEEMKTRLEENAKEA